MHRGPRANRWIAGAVANALATACTPTVQIAPPSEPIVINLNVKIEHELRIRVEKEVDDLLSENEDLFGGSQ